MTHESLPQPPEQKPAAEFGLTENEQLFWRVTDKRFQEFLLDDKTIIHEAKDSTNNYGDFLFVTVSRPGNKERVGVTFYGLGYHEYRERMIKDEWFWYPTTINKEASQEVVPKAEFAKFFEKRLEHLFSLNFTNPQSDSGALFELLADLTDEDGALAEMEDLDFSFSDFMDEPDLGERQEALPLMDENIRQELPGLYSQEKLGLKAMAKVKYFTPDSNWTWYASEFDGEDLFFGLVSGMEVELGYFSLKELQTICGPNGLPIERDLYFEPQSLGELLTMHKQSRGEG